ARTRTPRAATWRSRCPLTGSRWTDRALGPHAAAAQSVLLLFAQRRHGPRVVDDRRASGRGLQPAGEERRATEQRRLLHEHPVARSHDDEARAVAHVVGAAALFYACPPPALLRAALLVVVHEQVVDRDHLPAARLRRVLVDAVPAHRRPEAADVR